MISLPSFLFVSALLFACGTACILIRRNAVHILMGIELVLNAAALNFAAFARFTPAAEGFSPLTGQVVVLFVIALAAAEAMVALALIFSLSRVLRSVNVRDASELKG